MKLLIAPNAELAGMAADNLEAVLSKCRRPLLCVASGDSPRALYRELVKRHLERGIMHDWHFIGLDEWVGLGAGDEGSCRFMIDRDLFLPAGINPERIHFFEGKAADLSSECERMENLILSLEGIDIALLGLGMNGHIGLNEPGTPADSRSHVTQLEEKTKTVGQKYFSSPRVLSEGITLGLGTLKEAGELWLLVNGPHKAGILKQAMYGPVTADLPATLLRSHPGLFVLADEAAASETGP